MENGLSVHLFTTGFAASWDIVTKFGMRVPEVGAVAIDVWMLPAILNQDWKLTLVWFYPPFFGIGLAAS